ncbi:hypothetical protein Tco_0571467 [Tanacetum coccineum]
MVLHASVKKSSEEDTSEKKETNDEPPVKKLKFLVPISLIPSPTPLKSIIPEPLQKPDATNMTMDQFTKYLNKTTSSIFSPTFPREPSPPRDPTPPRDESKGKASKIPNCKSFVILEEQLTQEYVMAQLKEMKRLANLKAEKEKSEKFLKKILNPATIRAKT